MRHSARFLALLAFVVAGLAGASATAMPKLEDRGQAPAPARTPSPASVASSEEPEAATRPNTEDDQGPAQRAGAQQNAGAQATPTPTPSGSSPAPQPTPSNTPGGGSGGGGGNGGGNGQLVVSTSSSKLLAELGDVVEYTVTVSNSGDGELRDVSIVESVAPELDVVSVALSDDADGQSLGRGPAGEDIVWQISRMEPNKTVTFTWKGQAAAAGDLMAVNSVEATASGARSSQDSSTTFLGVDREVTADNPKPEPVEKKVVVYGTRIVNAAPAETAADGSVLPATGYNVAAYISLGALLVGGGLLVLAVFRSSMNGKRAGASAAIAGLLLAACVSGTPDQQAAPEEPPSDEQSVDAIDGDDAPEDRVKGKRIERTEEERAAEEGVDVADGDPEVAAPSTETAAPNVERTRTVETVLVSPEDLPVDELASRDGDNTMTYEWDLDARAFTTAASSVIYEAGATTELLTSLAVDQRSINVTVTLQNLSEDTRLIVRGRLVHVVSDNSGQIARFESDPIDTTLEPGGTVSTDFSYLLPSGGYTATSAFSAS